MGLRYLFILIFVASCPLAPAIAAQDCKNPQTQIAMNICSQEEYEREGIRLNKNYKELVAKLDTSRRTQLKEVQLAWIKFRDLQCKYDASLYEGGSMQPLIQANCLLYITKQRNKDIKAMLDDPLL